MRKVTLEELYSEILAISDSTDENPRLNMLKEEIHDDLKNQKDMENPDQERELKFWWERYQGLSPYIYR